MLFKQNTSTGGILYDIGKIINEREGGELWASMLVTLTKQGTDKTGRLALPSIGAL